MPWTVVSETDEQRVDQGRRLKVQVTSSVPNPFVRLR
jgi:hypothetical protein